MINANKLKKLKQQVRGKHPEIAARAGVTTYTVSRVLNGHWVNDAVIEAAIAVRNEKQKQFDILSAQI